MMNRWILLMVVAVLTPTAFAADSPVKEHPAPDLSTPTKAAAEFARALAAGDADAAARASLDTPRTRGFITAYGSVARSIHRLDESSAKAWGKDGGDVTAGIPNPAARLVRDLADSKEDVSGDTARVKNATGDAEIPLRRVDGQWRVDLTDLTARPESDLIIQGLCRVLTKVLDAMTADVDAGQFKDAPEAKAAFRQRMQNASRPKPGK